MPANNFGWFEKQEVEAHLKEGGGTGVETLSKGPILWFGFIHKRKGKKVWVFGGREVRS